MTREELGSLLRLLVDTGRITAADAATMVVRFDLGELAQADLPVPLSQMPGRLTPMELATAMQSVAVRLTPKQAEPFLAAATKPVTIETPPEVKEFLRNRLASHFRADYDRKVAAYTKALADGGDVAFWHKKMQLENHAYIARMATAGHGRPLTVAEVDKVSQIAIVQQGYLYRFSGEIAARRAIGSDFSEPYLQARIRQYGGAGWQSFWEAAETAKTLGQDGYIVHYQSADSPTTCSPCIDAQNNGPYRAGSSYPRPGEVCKGRGLCKCTLRFEYAPDTWKELAA